MSNDNRRDLEPSPLAGALLLAVVALAWPAPAPAQTSASLTVASSYDARGVVLSSQPVVQLRIERDIDSGWYAGAFASPVMLGGSATQAELIAYAGKAVQLPSGLSWDAGLSRTSFLRDTGYSYSELYAGVVLDRASARLFLSPDYYGDGRSAYLDLNAFYPLGERYRLIAHAGLRHTFPAYRYGASDHLDLRFGVAADFGNWSAQATVGSLQKAYGDGLRRTNQFALSVSRHY